MSGIPAKRTPNPTLKNIGKTLAAELAAIINNMGPGHPDLNAEMLVYIQQLDQLHPTWQPVMDQARQRLIGGKPGGPIHRRSH